MKILFVAPDRVSEVRNRVPMKKVVPLLHSVTGSITSVIEKRFEPFRFLLVILLGPLHFITEVVTTGRFHPTFGRGSRTN